MPTKGKEKRGQTQTASEASQPAESLFPVYLLLSLAVIVNFNTIFNHFVFDDEKAIVENPDVIASSPLSSVFQNDFWGYVVYFLIMLFFWL